MQFSLPVIDAHMHLKTWYDRLGRDPFTFFIENRKAHNLRAYNICALATVPDGNYDASNAMIAALVKLRDPHAYAYAGLVYPAIPAPRPLPPEFSPLTQYEELMALGFDGIKMLETKPTVEKLYQVDLAGEEFEPFFARCEQDGVHMIWHACDPDAFWDIHRISQRHLEQGWYYGDGTYRSLEWFYERIFKILNRHPKLNVTFAHFFFLSEQPEKLEALFRAYENISVDITPGAEMYASFQKRRDFYRDFFTKYADRILYGTDTVFGGMPINREKEDMVYRVLTTDEEVRVIDTPCRGLALPDRVCEKILYQNFEHFCGKKPRAVNRSVLKKYYEKYRPFIVAEDIRKPLDAEMEKL